MFVLEASGVLPERGFLSDRPFIVLTTLLFFGILDHLCRSRNFGTACGTSTSSSGRPRSTASS